MCLLAERSVDATPLKVEFLRKKLWKAWRQGRLWRGNEPAHQRWRLCEARLTLGEFGDWDGWEYRDPWVAGLWHNPDRFSVPVWDGMKTGTLYVFGEQGLGDEIFFASCLGEAIKRSDKVILETEPRLMSIFERSFPVECRSCEIVEVGDKRGRQQKEPEGDHWIPFGELPRIFRKRLPFPCGPYLKPDPAEMRKYERYRGRTGISWRGAQGEYRWEELASLADRPLSLQYDHEWDCDLERPELDLHYDLEGLMGLLANLRKVITVSTTVAHLSAAMGVDTTVILAPPNGRNANRFAWKWFAVNNRSAWYGVKVYASLAMVPRSRERERVAA